MRSRSLFVLAAVAVPVAAFAGFRASSFKKETHLGANYWNAAAALDNKLDTCWMVDPESENKGEWFEVDIPKSTVDKLALVVGWDKDADTFHDYPRIKSVRVEVFGTPADETAKVGEANLTFEDKEGWQTVDMPDFDVGSDITGGKVRFTVTDFYPGEDYPNLGVSEVLVKLKESDVDKGNIKFTTPPPAATGHDSAMMTDGNAKTWWASAAPGEQTFDVKAGGFGISSVGIVAGPLTSARPKTVDMTVNDQTVTCNLADKPEVQWCELPALTGYTGSSWGAITVDVKDTYPGKTDQNVGITELQLRSTNYEAL